jgi:isocitrate dehydrogenase
MAQMSTAGERLVTLIPGDGIGPEVVQAARRVVEATGAAVRWQECEAGAEVFRRGLPSGVPGETIESIRQTRVVLKGPLETPGGFGENSATVTLRKLFEAYANVRPVRELPGVPTPYSGRGIDLVLVRENVEDLYAGIEHMQTPGVAQCLKLISRKGCEKIVRLAFELAVAEGRRKVHCATKADIMKLTEGLLKRTFEDVARDYRDIAAEHIIVNNCAHQLVKRPEQFDVIVTSNMNGDTLSDLASGLVGGLAFAASGNLGQEVAIFEAVHGSAPQYAGKDVVNPTAMILSAAMMLRYLGDLEAAAAIEGAVVVTLEEGVHTRDVTGDRQPVSTTAFTDTVIANLGRRPTSWRGRDYRPLRLPEVPSTPDVVKVSSRRVVGVDVFVESARSAESLGKSLERLVAHTPLQLAMVSNRGAKVYRASGAMTDPVDHWRCRFLLRTPGANLEDGVLLELVQRISERHRWMHIEKLSEFDGELGFTRAQGED